MTDERVNEAKKPTGETPAGTAGERAARTARASDPIMDRIERSAGRIKARLTAKGGADDERA